MPDDKSVLEARYLPKDISVSDLHSSAWDEAQPALIDHYWSGAPAPVGRHAEARILWSSTALFVRYLANQAEPPVINPNPQTFKKTMYLWDRDVCEIFIATDPNFVERYLEFEVAPTGEWLDVALDWTTGKRQSDWEFQSHMTTAAEVEKDRLRMAMRIPWSNSLHQPHKGERWRINLLRCVGRDPNRGYLSWQPTRTPEPSFHVPQALGSLLFT